MIDRMNRNCTLVAVREVSRLDDDKILEAFRRHGYVDHRGMQTDKWIAAAEDLGIETEKVEDVKTQLVLKTRMNKWDEEESYWKQTGMSLAEVRDKYSEGVYFATISGHALVLRDGRIIDHNMKKGKTRALVKSLYLVKNPAHVEEPTDYLECSVKFGTCYGRRGALYERRRSARAYAGLQSNKLLDIIQNTDYTFEDFMWEYRNGAVTIIST